MSGCDRKYRVAIYWKNISVTLFCYCTIFTVHNRIGLCLWKKDSIREFQTLFVTHTDFIREKLDKVEGVSV